MTVWVDGDACPNVIKEILFRAAERWQVSLILVANQPLKVPPSRFIRTQQVLSGFDVADNHIVAQLEAGDLVITADIPLASDAIEKGGDALNPRGQAYTRENIRQRLAMRNFMEEMRSTGVQTGGPAIFSQQDRKEFADALDRWLQRWKRTQPMSSPEPGPSPE